MAKDSKEVVNDGIPYHRIRIELVTNCNTKGKFSQCFKQEVIMDASLLDLAFDKAAVFNREGSMAVEACISSAGIVGRQADDK